MERPDRSDVFEDRSATGGGRSTHPATRTISDALTTLQREHYGKGPRVTRTIVDGDLVLVVMRGGFTRVERTLHERGRADAVLSQRAAFQEALRPAVEAIVAREVDRRVIAATFATHVEPDVSTAVFVLDAPVSDGPRDPDGLGGRDEDADPAPAG